MKILRVSIGFFIGFLGVPKRFKIKPLMLRDPSYPLNLGLTWPKMSFPK